jgi:hypothetical protein
MEETSVEFSVKQARVISWSEVVCVKFGGDDGDGQFQASSHHVNETFPMRERK